MLKYVIIFCCLLIAAVQNFIFRFRDFLWHNVRERIGNKPHARPNTTNGERIIGGMEATRGQFPYQAFCFTNGHTVNNGALITSSVVLISAMITLGSSFYEVTLGAHNQSDYNESGRVYIRTDNWIVHENFDSNTREYNIALLFLNQDVELTSTISPVRLPALSMADWTFEGEIGRITGWGNTDVANNYGVEILHYNDVTVIDIFDCLDIWEYYVNPRTLCIDTRGGTAAVCSYGDGGSPLVITEEDGIATLIGVFSWRDYEVGCTSSLPQGFTKISKLVDWVVEKIDITIRP